MSFEQLPNSQSIHEIYSKRERYIPEVGEQLEEKKTIQVEIQGEKLNIDYRVISIAEKENKEAEPVVLLQGFGSGWEGIAEMGFSLAAEGRRVILLSLPGYGNSESPSEQYCKNTTGFSHEAEALRQIVEEIRSNGEIKNGAKPHVVGHSMGAIVGATYAANNPKSVSSITLISPGGVEKENPAALGVKFVASGAHAALDYSEHSTRKAFSEMRDYEKKLYQYIPKTKSPFERSRLAQRMSEARRIAQPKLLKQLPDVGCPITYISGTLDTVYHAGWKDGQLQKIIQAADREVKVSIMHAGFHNSTQGHDEITASNIEHYLEQAEKEKR